MTLKQMFNRYVVCLAELPFLGTGASWAAVPDTLRVTLSEVVCMAQERSSDAMAARHTLEAAEWSYRYYRADRLPSVTLSSSPNLDRQLNSITQPDGTNLFRQQNQLSTNLTLNISQNVAKTGGNLFVRSSLQRQDEFENRWHAYSNTPVLVGYSQSLFGYNGLKWERRTEPLRYQRAQKAYRETMELIASRASSYFLSTTSPTHGSSAGQTTPP